jgi:hypothetical protein
MRAAGKLGAIPPFSDHAHPMTVSFAGLLFALFGFVATFAAARALATWVKRRQSRRTEQVAFENQSRQVRRANERARKR